MCCFVLRSHRRTGIHSRDRRRRLVCKPRYPSAACETSSPWSYTSCSAGVGILDLSSWQTCRGSFPILSSDPSFQKTTKTLKITMAEENGESTRKMAGGLLFGRDIGRSPPLSAAKTRPGLPDLVALWQGGSKPLEGEANPDGSWVGFLSC